MSIVKSSEPIYPVLDEVFQKATRPLTCADLLAIPAVFAAATRRWGDDKARVSDKLSDTLGFMWRRGTLDRFEAPPSHSMARYAYALPGKFLPNGQIEKIERPLTKAKGDLSIVEQANGEVVLEFEKFTIVIKPKQ